MTRYLRYLRNRWWLFMASVWLWKSKAHNRSADYHIDCSDECNRMTSLYLDLVKASIRPPITPVREEFENGNDED